MANKVLTVEQIIARGRSEGFTAYQIWKLIDAKLTAAGYPEHGVRPQMIYNYDRQGMVVKGHKNVTASRTFTEAEVMSFVEKFTTRKIEKLQAAKAAETETEAQVEGQLELDIEI